MAEVRCVRCKEVREGLSNPPFRNELGTRLQEAVCAQCWQDWLRQQTAIINHYGLNLLEPAAKEFLFQQVETFFFGESVPNS